MFLPKKSQVLIKLVEQSSVVEEGAKILKEAFNNLSELKHCCARLEILEFKGDEFVHEITEEIEKIFILPLDKEDIKEMTDRLDDILDEIEQLANRLYLYDITKGNESSIEFSDLILQAVKQIHKGLILVNEHKFHSDEFLECFENLHTLENQGDKLHRRVLKELMSEASANFNNETLLSLIKWKEIFQMLEDTLDICEDVAIIFGRLRIKYR
ncbi:MAG: DUF47 family protein [Candidatus Aminicenantes bacterium]|nr:DUF47 family protein [Candidatus Aminicenantes bacterium]